MAEQVRDPARLRHHGDPAVRILPCHERVAGTAAHVHVHEVPTERTPVDRVLRLSDRAGELLLLPHAGTPA